MSLTELTETWPDEDAGSSTAGYYEFQYGWVAKFCLDMAAGQGELEWILCEWHTDFILGWHSTMAPVSVKSREPNAGAWTLAKLFSDGGMLTLYRRWLALGKPRECRWITNGGMNGECQRLQQMCRKEDAAAIKVWIGHHKYRFGQEVETADLLAFLRALRIDNDGPRPSDQRIVNIETHARRSLRLMGRSPAHAAEAYDRCVDMARKASRGFAVIEPEWTSAARGALNSGALAAATARRRLLKADVMRSMINEITDPIAAHVPPVAGDATTLVKKLRRGKVVPTAEAAARRARLQWSAFEASFSEPIPRNSGPSDFARLRSQVLHAATQAQIAASREGNPYGDHMLEQLEERMSQMARDAPPVHGVRTDLLMGLVYDLTARCEVWWSDRFDVNTERECLGE